MLRVLVVAPLAAGIVLAGCGGTAGDDGNASGGGGGQNDLTAGLPAVPVAEKLAARDERSLRCAGRKRCPRSLGDSPGAALTAQFDTQLLNLVFKCEQDRASLKDKLGLLADYTVKAQKVLAEQGRNESLIRIITNVNGSIPFGSPRRPCPDAFDDYVTFVSRGQVRDVPLQTDG